MLHISCICRRCIKDLRWTSTISRKSSSAYVKSLLFQCSRSYASEGPRPGEVFKNPGFVGPAKWPTTVDVPLERIKTIFNPYTVTLYSNMCNESKYSSVKFETTKKEQEEHIQSKLVTHTHELKNLDQRILINLGRMQMNMLTPIQQYMFALFSVFTSQVSHLRLLTHNSLTSREEIAAFALPIVNSICCQYPYEAMRLLKEHNFQTQFPLAVFVVPSPLVGSFCREYIHPMSYQTRLLVRAPFNRRGGCHVLIGQPHEIHKFIQSGEISLGACEHFVVLDTDMLLLNSRMHLHGVLQHSTRGLITSPNVVSSILFTREKDVSPELSALMNILKTPQKNRTLHEWVRMHLQLAAPTTNEEATGAEVSYSAKAWLMPLKDLKVEQYLFSEKANIHYEVAQQRPVVIHRDQFQVENWSEQQMSEFCERQVPADVSEVHGLYPLIRRNLLHMGVHKLTAVEQMVYTLFTGGHGKVSAGANKSPLEEVRLTVQGVPSALDSMLMYLMPVVNTLATEFPSRAYELYYKFEKTVQFPSVLILVRNTTRAILVNNELRWLRYGTRIRSQVLPGKEDASSTLFHIIIGTPTDVLRRLKEGTLSLAACQHVVYDRVHRFNFVSAVKELMNHPTKGLLACPTDERRSTVIFTGSIRPTDSLLPFLRDNVTSLNKEQFYADVQKCSFINVLCNNRCPPPEIGRLEYVFEEVNVGGEIGERLTYWLQTLRGKRILIIWDGMSSPTSWLQAGVKHFVKSTKSWLDYKEVVNLCDEFSHGKFNVLLIQAAFLSVGFLPLPQVDVLLHVSCDNVPFVTEFVQLHQLLLNSAGNTPSFSVTILSSMRPTNLNSATNFARVLVESDVPIPTWLQVHLDNGAETRVDGNLEQE